MVAVIGIDLIANPPSPSGPAPTPGRRLAEVVENARLFEDLGFDGFGVGERHHAPFLSSAPPVVLSHIAAVTSRIRLFTGVTLLSVLDPVRVAEDYATLDHLSGGRVELIIGKGNGPEQAELFGVGRTQAWDTLDENYRLLRRLWSGEPVTWEPPQDGRPRIRHAALRDAVVLPAPLQPRIRVWHGSATAERSVELAAEFGDPVFSANGFNPVEYYARLVRHYRAAWEQRGRDPRQALVGAGHQVHVQARSQDAVERYRPVYEQLAAALAANDTHLPGTRTEYRDYADWLERGSALIGSPAQVLEKALRYHEEFGNQVLSITAHPGGIDRDAHRSSLELFAEAVRPDLDAAIPSPPWPEPLDASSAALAVGVPA